MSGLGAKVKSSAMQRSSWGASALRASEAEVTASVVQRSSWGTSALRASGLGDGVSDAGGVGEG